MLFDPRAPTGSLQPVLEHVTFARVVCGPDHGVAITTDGAVYSWGAGGYRAHGVAPPACHSRGLKCVVGTPPLLAPPRPARHGQLGHGEPVSHAVPRQIGALKDIPIRQAACGTWHTLFLSGTRSSGPRCRAAELTPAGLAAREPPPTDAGDVYACGWDEDGQLGLRGDATLNTALPNALDLPDPQTGAPSADVTATAVAAGAAHSAVLTGTAGQRTAHSQGAHG